EDDIFGGVEFLNDPAFHRRVRTAGTSVLIEKGVGAEVQRNIFKAEQQKMPVRQNLHIVAVGKNTVLTPGGIHDGKSAVHKEKTPHQGIRHPTVGVQFKIAGSDA